MTSLTALSHGTSAAAPPFNSGFYTTVATVIPVLFLAIAIQSRRGFRELLSRSHNLAQARHRAVRDSEDPLRSKLPDIAYAAATDLLLAILYGIVGAGTLGEALAIFALYGEHDSLTMRIEVLLSVLLLLSVLPAMALLGFDRTESARAPAGNELGKSAAPAPESDTDKTDTG